MSDNRPPVPDGAALDTREVAGKGKRKRRKRTTQATTLRSIHAVARERQAAWAASGQRTLTDQLTQELEQLYGDLRDERKGTNPGRHLRTSAAVAQWASEATR
jgi:hypothetical protein